jgi:hypothetical protein
MCEVKHLRGEGKSGKTMNFGTLARAILLVASVALRFSLGAATNELKIGAARVDPARRSISFPAVVNQREGAIEYLLVHETGKVHESIFKTSVAPQEIHAAALLFSEKAANGVPKLKIETIEVSWKDGEKENRFNAAELIFDKKHRRPLRDTKWAYRGSRLIDGIFLAQRDGSIIAIMEDRDALIDQDTPDASDDENWEPVTERVPAIGKPVSIRIQFSEK